MSATENARAPWRAACRALAQARARAEDEATDASGLPSLAYRWEHVQAVVGLSLRLAPQVGADDAIVEAAAWLHDINKGQRDHAAAAAAEARTFLPNTDFPPARISAVVAAIAQHEGLTRLPGAAPLEPLEAAVLWDADKLSKLGVSAIALALGAPHVHGQTLAERRLYVNDFARGVLAQSVTSMNTAPARAMAQRRYAAMLAALDAWASDQAEAQFYDLWDEEECT